MLCPASLPAAVAGAKHKKMRTLVQVNIKKQFSFDFDLIYAQ